MFTMTLPSGESISCDVLIIGGGGAGLTAAIKARETGAEVIIASKSRVGYGNNTYISKGVFAAATGRPDRRDNPETHVNDSLKGGRSINDRNLLEVVARRAGAQISFLEKCGVPFKKQAGNIHVMLTPGHRYPRNVRGENQSGRDFSVPLREYAHKIGVRFIEKVFITKLFQSKGRLVGAGGVSHDLKFLTFPAKCVILATGGFGQAYLQNNNAAGMTGDGYALAFELGVSLKDMEFVQFYPTAMGKRANRILLYESFVVRLGAVLKNINGEDIIKKYGLEDPPLLTRDRLTRAVMQEILVGHDVEGGVIMDFNPVPDDKLATLNHLLPAAGLPGSREIIVSPTTHFCMGGVMIDNNTQTAIPGLLAAGEVCGGVHGANRLGGNALAEVFAMGGVSGLHSASFADEAHSPKIPEEDVAAERTRLESFLSSGDRKPQEFRNAIKKIMWNDVGVIREMQGLEKALKGIEELKSCISRLHIEDVKSLVKSLELKNLLLVGEMVCRAALMRTESRGAHYRSDFPDEDNDHWLKNVVIRKDNSHMKLQAIPVSDRLDEQPLR